MNIIVNGMQEFMGKQIPVVEGEGGFGEGKKVVLAKTISEVHGSELRVVNQLINENIEEFEEGVDILDLKNSISSVDSLLKLGFTKQSIANSKNIYLLSEQGYMLLVGFMRTEKAKELRKQFRREYFVMKQVIQSDEQKKKELAYQLLIGGIDSIQAHKQLVEIEVKEATVPLIKEIDGKNTIIDNVIKDDKVYAVGVVGKVLSNYSKNMGTRKIFEYLRNENVLMDNKGTQRHNLPYAAYERYFDIKYVDYDAGYYSDTYAKCYFNGKGVKWLLNKLVKNGDMTKDQRDVAEKKIA